MLAAPAQPRQLFHLSLAVPDLYGVGLQPHFHHLADQLLLPMALGEGGSFTTLAPSTHTMTNIEIIQRFIDVPITVEELGEMTRVVVGVRS